MLIALCLACLDTPAVVFACVFCCVLRSRRCALPTHTQTPTTRLSYALRLHLHLRCTAPLVALDHCGLCCWW
eukprot:m.327311 g.327311  ORF g.327311 m.327311 type:complete len:72 (+) comp19748_c3_seq4:144-359(+)